ncbi:MAG: alpha/beta fold hydrolase [Hamadaea sp.]|uniref:alpha/beta fold hydrolase n=1 Tax=Hamadaea sp. TaxID=2024425 RepID=UPI0017B09F56|nr:alpha/beta fold hydrolase [Hamadaea sp.]NUR70510.1 alpha/beta fold hydrolase [Hamadaea sp.]NUT18117.1 alpha/beta fold hydrolase [Hamadaea sp.]
MKPRLLLLHGVARTGQSWAAHRPLLAEKFDVVTPDLPGFGDAPGPFRLDSAVAGIADALDDETDAGGVRTTIVCGHSADAMVALRLAARRAAAGIGGAELHLQPGGDHLWSESEPTAFSGLLVTRACRTRLA